MKNIKILIIEDEPIIAQDMAMMLRKKDYDVVGIAMDYEEAIELVSTTDPDLVLLDINLESEKTGVDIGHVLKNEHGIPFIYLTSYADQETLNEVLPTNPSGYLIKPIKFSELNNNIKIAIKNFEDYKADVGDIKEINEFHKDFLFVKNKKSLQKIKVDELLFAKACDNYTYLCTVDNRYLISSTLKSIFEKLDHATFLRVHRSYIVNINKIDNIESNSIQLNKEIIPISRGYQKDFFERLNIV